MATKANSPCVIVLASGRGERFIAAGGTGPKLQAPLAGKPLLERTLDAVRASGLPWRLEGRRSPPTVHSVIALGSGTCASMASPSQRSNCLSGSSALCVSPSSARS